MFIHFGLYRFRPRRVAFRNDYCLICAKPRRAYELRTLNFIHLFWVPLLPVGYGKRWVCSGCNQPIGLPVKTRRGFHVLLLALMVLGTLTVWLAPLERESRADQRWFWFFRIIFPVGTSLFFVATRRNRRNPAYPRVLDVGVAPAEDILCPVDRTPLVCTSIWCCPLCGIERR